jgi:hypothetical protein
LHGKWVEGGSPMGEFMYELNEWRTICRWENLLWRKWRVNDTVEAQSNMNRDEITWESVGKARKMRRRSMLLILRNA